MGLIYMRTSPSGGRYIGQTVFPEKDRWRDHINEAYNPTSESYNTILNKAIRKYGPENFSVEILEDNLCDDLLDDREIYWIDYYKTFYLDNHHGYNMTRGGGGTRLVDTNLIINLWNQGLSSSEIIDKLHTNHAVISSRLKKIGVTSEDIQKRGRSLSIQKTKMVRKNRRDNDTDYVLNLWNEGKTIEEIKIALSRSYNYVSTILNDAGIDEKLRDKRQFERLRAGFISSYEKRHEQILKLWNKGYSSKEIQDELNISSSCITEHLKKENISTTERQKRRCKNQCKPVNQYDLNHNFIKEWPSAAEIARVLGLNKSHIGEVCRGKAKTCGGFIWKYKDLT